MPHASIAESDLGLSGRRFSVEYHIHGSAAEARERTTLLCIDQTIEAADHVIPSGVIRDQLLGRLRTLGIGRSRAPSHRDQLSLELLDGSVGISSI